MVLEFVQEGDESGAVTAAGDAVSARTFGFELVDGISEPADRVHAGVGAEAFGDAVRDLLFHDQAFRVRS